MPPGSGTPPVLREGRRTAVLTSSCVSVRVRMRSSRAASYRIASSVGDSAMAAKTRNTTTLTLRITGSRKPEAVAPPEPPTISPAGLLAGDMRTAAIAV